MEWTGRKVWFVGLGVLVLGVPAGWASAEYDTIQMPKCQGGRTVDGVVTDWSSDPDYWIDLDQTYSGNPQDITSAKYTACWDPVEDKIYAAIVVEDTDHVFESAPTAANSSDRVEIFVQGALWPEDDWWSWWSDPCYYYDIAQHYAVGYMGILPGWSWAAFGNGVYIPGDTEPGDADFYAAARVSGGTITYEIGATAFIWY